MSDVFVAVAVVAAVVAVYATLIRLAQGIDRVEQMRAADDQRMIRHLRTNYAEHDNETGQPT